MTESCRYFEGQCSDCPSLNNDYGICYEYIQFNREVDEYTQGTIQLERFVKSHDGATMARLLGLRVRPGNRIIIGYMDRHSQQEGYLVNPDGLTVAELNRLGLMTSNAIYRMY